MLILKMDNLTDTSSVPGKPFNLIFINWKSLMKQKNSPKNVSNSYILWINYLKKCFHEDNYYLGQNKNKKIKNKKMTEKRILEMERKCQGKY